MRVALFFALLITFASPSASQTVIPAIYAQDIVTDGIITVNEWLSSSTISISAPGNSIKVHVAYDSLYLYVLYYGKLESANTLFPELLLDINNSKSNAWENDDWWFHVSATDCENQGAYGVYTNCAVTQTHWIGAPNFNVGPPITDTVEMAIEWSKIGFDPFSGNDLGISLLASNTANLWYGWPATYNRNNPSSWGILDFTVNLTGIKNSLSQEEFIIYPNPSACTVTFNNLSAHIEGTLHIVNILGETVYQEQIRSTKFEMEFNTKGVFEASFIDKSGKVISRKKLLIN